MISALAEMTDVFLQVADRVVCCHKLVISAFQTYTSFWREVTCNAYLCICKTNWGKWFRWKLHKLTIINTLSSPRIWLLSLSIQLRYNGYNVVKASNFEYHRGAQFFQLYGSPRQIFSRQTGDTNQIPYSMPTNIRRQNVQFSCSCDLVPGICPPVRQQ
jgi:hypothetical protein